MKGPPSRPGSRCGTRASSRQGILVTPQYTMRSLGQSGRTGLPATQLPGSQGPKPLHHSCTFKGEHLKPDDDDDDASMDFYCDIALLSGPLDSASSIE